MVSSLSRLKPGSACDLSWVFQRGDFTMHLEHQAERETLLINLCQALYYT